MRFRRLLCISILLVTLLAAAGALAETSISVHFQGLTPHADGLWTADALSGVFDVYQGDALLGTLEVTDGVSGALPCGEESVLLQPRPESVTPGYLLQEGGYAVSIVPGQENTAQLLIYADAGFLEIRGGTPGVEYVLMDEEEQEVLRLTADEEGACASPDAVPGGVYVLHQETGENPWPDVLVEITPYRGTGSGSTVVDAAYVQAAMLTAVAPTLEPAPEPTAELTEVPTEVPTEAPTEVPTEEPTEEPTPIPTEEPTEASTETPIPTETPVPTELPTPELTEIPTLEPTEVPTEDWKRTLL